MFDSFPLIHCESLFLNEEKVENNKLSNAHMEIKKDVGTIVDQTNDIDLFNNHSQSTSIDHQIDLIIRYQKICGGKLIKLFLIKIFDYFLIILNYFK